MRLTLTFDPRAQNRSSGPTSIKDHIDAAKGRRSLFSCRNKPCLCGKSESVKREVDVFFSISAGLILLSRDLDSQQQHVFHSVCLTETITLPSLLFYYNFLHFG